MLRRPRRDITTLINDGAQPRRRGRQITEPEHDTPLGSTIRRLRIQRAMTTRELANQAGVSQPYISQIEHGRISSPSPAVIQALANAFDVSVDALRNEIAGPSPVAHPTPRAQSSNDSEELREWAMARARTELRHQSRYVLVPRPGKPSLELIRAGIKAAMLAHRSGESGGAIEEIRSLVGVLAELDPDENPDLANFEVEIFYRLADYELDVRRTGAAARCIDRAIRRRRETDNLAAECSRKELGERRIPSCQLVRLRAAINVALGNWKDATRDYELARQLVPAYPGEDQTMMLAVIANGFAWFRNLQGDYESATWHANEADRLGKKVGRHRRSDAYWQANLARTRLAIITSEIEANPWWRSKLRLLPSATIQTTPTDRLDEGLRLAYDARLAFEDVGDERNAAEVNVTIAGYLLELGDPYRAEKTVELVIGYSKTFDLFPLHILALRQLARILSRIGEHEPAQSKIEQAQSLHVEVEDDYEVARTARVYGEVLMRGAQAGFFDPDREASLQRAQTHLRGAAEIFSGQRNPQLQAASDLDRTRHLLVGCDEMLADWKINQRRGRSAAS